MKTVDFERMLVTSGFALVRTGKHHVYSNGVKQVAVPKSREMNKMVVRRLIKEFNLKD